MLHVLVVEDDEDTAASLAMLLRLYGHNVEVAADGPCACRAVEANPYDVVLLDIAMPKMDGWQAARRIRQHHNGNMPLLIAVSGYGTEADKRRSGEVGIDLHLVKPVDPAELVHLLRCTVDSTYFESLIRLSDWVRLRESPEVRGAESGESLPLAVLIAPA